MEYETYRIPANFADAGRVFGQFAIRNTVEAVILAGPPAAACFFMLPFSLTVRVIAALILAVPLAGFALLGVNGDPLTVHIRNWLTWLFRRRVAFYRGTPAIEKRRKRK